MKQACTLLLIFMGITVLTKAQNDPNAKKVLDGVSSKLNTVKGITAGFSYTTKDRNKTLKGSVKGQISIKGQKYYIKQGTTEIFCNGVKVWNFNGEDEVTVADADNSDDKTLSPQKLLSNFYDKDFTYKLISSTGTFHQILMIPTDKRKNFKQVTIFIDKSKNLISKADVVDKSDNTIGFTLSNINTNISLPDSKFEFDTAKHPGVEVVEQ
ncbi:MAG TPA: outer membrane lipoprotein carrier protein LolA [Panacibacter sp.]|nr:outer membrane lipoprotein carrier protein LolA [Panacibacter sp.]